MSILQKIKLLSLVLCLSIAVFSQVTVVDTIVVGDSPFGVVVNPQTNRIYVANSGSDNVSVIDGSGDSVIATIGVGDYPIGVGVNPQTNRIYVANVLSDNVSIIDGSGDSVIATIGVGFFPVGVGVNPQTNRIYVSCAIYGTVWVLQDATGVVEDSPYNPRELNFTIYPNPFSQKTYLRCTLPKASRVNLTVYDITGRLVTTLIDDWRNVGTHEITFDGSKLASGIYFYRLKAGEFTETKKMILVR